MAGTEALTGPCYAVKDKMLHDVSSHAIHGGICRNGDRNAVRRQGKILASPMLDETDFTCQRISLAVILYERHECVQGKPFEKWFLSALPDTSRNSLGGSAS